MFDRFRAAVREFKSRIAVSNESEKASFSELLERVEWLRPLLASEENPVLVLLMLPSGPNFTAVQLAGLAEKAVVAPISHRATSREIENYLKLIRPDLIVATGVAAARPVLEFLQEPVTVLVDSKNAEDVGGHRVVDWGELQLSQPPALAPREHGLRESAALVQFTSGSTGLPKGVVLTADNLLAYLDHNQEFLSRSEGQDVFCPMPQFHAFGGTVVLEHLLNGAAVHLTNTYMPGEHLKRMQERQCRAILAAPTYLRLLLQMNALSSNTVPQLSSVSMGSAAIDRTLVGELQGQFPMLEIHLRYGLTETMGPISRLSLRPGEELEAPGLVGFAVPGVEIKTETTTPGDEVPREVRVRSEVVAPGQILEQGSWQPLLDSDGFFATGDLGYVDGKGRLFLRGRISTFIKRNGFRVDPFEIETLLKQQIGVGEAVALGIPDPVAGQEVVVCVEPGPGSSLEDGKELMAACRENLSVAKVPQRVLLINAMPRTPSGKPDRMRLIEQLTGESRQFS